MTAPVLRRGRVLRRLRRRRQPARDDHLQRGVLRRLRRRHPPTAHHLHLALPGRPGGDRQLRRDRSAVPKRHAPRRAHPHVLQRHVGDGRVLRRQRRPHRARGEPRRDQPGAGRRQDRSRARRPKLVDPNDVCATLSPGETEQISNGDPGFDVAFDRVIDQPGKPERREHYTWHYTMLPNQILVGNSPDAPTTTGRPPVNPTTPRSTTPGSTTPTPAAHRPKRTRLGRSDARSRLNRPDPRADPSDSSARPGRRVEGPTSCEARRARPGAWPGRRS